jgi:hypothetical protein
LPGIALLGSSLNELPAGRNRARPVSHPGSPGIALGGSKILAAERWQ